MRGEKALGYTPTKVPESKRRTRERENGYSDGYRGAPKRSTDPEYLTSYRRGQEARS
jgi:hypothetical protein